MRRYKQNDRNQLLLMPPNIDDWLPERHLARFVVETVDLLNLRDFHCVYESSGGGQPPYDPAVMLALLLYGYMTGVVSSRKIEQATWTDVAFRYIAANLHPDHDTVAEFRRRHQVAIGRVFVQVVQIALQAKIVRLGHVSLDGTKIRANASKEKRRTKEQLERELKAIEEWFGKQLDEGERVDEEEDAEFGKGNNGYSLPDSLKTKEQRAEAIRDALQALEEQKAKQEKEDPDGRIKRVREQKKGKAEVPKVNTTDVDSRTMLFRHGVFDEGYNAQVVVDDDHGIIVAADVTQDGGDKRQILPMMLQVEENTGWLPDRVTADAGYFNEGQMTDARLKTIELYVKPKKQRIVRAKLLKPKFGDQMRELMETPLAQALYRMRMTLVEPVFGAIKQARGFRQFSLRGIEGVRAEWALVCMGHNLRKLFKLSPKLAVLLQ